LPKLSDVLTKGLPAGYVPVDSSPTPPPASQNDAAQTSSPRARCPLPPTSADADSLRTFEKGSSTPQWRVMPLPPQTGGASTVTTGGGTSSGSGGTSSGGGSSPAAVTRTVTVSGNVPANGALITRVAANRSFQLFSVGATAPCDIRLYGTQGAQSADVSRQIDAPVPAELTQGMILDVVLDTTPYFWNTQNICGANGDQPQSQNLYVSVFNLTGTPLSNVTVYITLVPIET